MRILIVFLLIIFCSCARKRSVDSDNSNHVLVIDLLTESGSKVTKLSEFAEKIDYIPLQTTKSSLIGPFVLKIVNMDNRIYIKNSGLDGGILCFDVDGKFLFRLQNKGRGPEEYASITDFDVSSDNKNLTILSSSNHKLLVYGITDNGFAFQRSISLKDPSPYKLGMVPETENVFLAIPPWRGTERTLSLLINTVGDTINFKPNCYKYNIVGKSISRASADMLVYSIANMVCFKEEFSDTVFYADARDNFFKPRIIFKSHGTLFTPEMRVGSEIPGSDVTRIDYIFETSRYVFCWYWTIESLNGFLFDRKVKKKYYFFKANDKIDLKTQILNNGLNDDLSGGPNINIEFTHNFFSSGKLFSFVDAITLKKYVASKDFKNAEVSDPKKKNELKKLADSLDETDNPVLIVVTPKE